MVSSALIWETEAWNDLKAHVEEIKKTHLRDLMSDPDRRRSMMVEFDGMLLDYSHQLATVETFEKLFKLAEEAHLKEKVNSMFSGEPLRAPRDAVIQCDGKNVVPEVWNVLDKIHDFSEKVHSGSSVGATGKTLTDVVSIGFGGSYLGPLLVHTAFQTARILSHDFSFQAILPYSQALEKFASHIQ
ncbi:Phosphoglucose isomerase (PGI), partial [Dillenia turbinata]